MLDGISAELNEQGRGVVGGLLVIGLADMYTMEMWWHGWQLPAWLLLSYGVVGLGLVLAVTHFVGFRDARTDDGGPVIGGLVRDFAELVLQSLLAAALVLVLFGVVDASTSPLVLVRLLVGLVVPMGFGAALANALLTGEKEGEMTQFPKNLGLFAVGATFVVGPIAPTEEMTLIAAHAGYGRLAALVVASVLASYAIMFELEFMGQRRRVSDRATFSLATEAVQAYAVALVVAAGLLGSYGHFLGSPAGVWVQKSVVLGFPGTVGASAAQVVLG